MRENVGARGLIFNEPLIFDISREGRDGASIPDGVGLPEKKIESLLPKGSLRDDIEGFPSLSEVDVVRHFTRLSQWNYGLDGGFYPLGSCTMKYNPKINEDMASLPALNNLHPYAPEGLAQGALRIMYELSDYLAEISGLAKVSLQPSAGAQGEFAGILIIKNYFESIGEKRHKIIVPDSAHGTNPASSALCGYQVIEVKSGSDGLIDPAEIEKHMDDDVAAIMLTNPNTLGLFESQILKITEIIHKKGGLVYMDGANLNALMGIVKPADMGVDIMHFNLHKTFSTPHGGGGPGSGPVGVTKKIAPFLPTPVIVENNGNYSFQYGNKDSIGRLRAFYGNFGVMVKAYVYIRSMGGDGLKKASETAVVNANYIKEKLKGIYHLPYDRECMHECVFSDKIQGENDVSTLDIAKAIIDRGFHPPTIYFPLIVHGAIMMEPTETEGKETLDSFIEALKDIAAKAKEDPGSLKASPEKPKVGRLDETQAARNPKLRWRAGQKDG
ncbi:MAG: aminomethyl-transferring glycine dehydrogenase subunit GcvPB [Nitrospinota bacterium]|nr:aminomethyl-transferring glycine dehydrogenase subunit GcvPB [Nitrospinota bacterium]